ncbi:MAG: pilus assembly protein PilW [Vibrio sp.]
MALKSAKYQGNTLIEFIIAALIGVIALGIIGGIFLANQKAAAQRSKQIMLQQQMSGVMQQMKEDIQRAGFDHMRTGSLQLSGASKILHLQPQILGYVYRPAAVSAPSNTVYKFEDNQLKYCQNTSSSENPETVEVTISRNCFNLFDPKQIKINQFNIVQTPLSGASVDSALLAITMAAELKNDSTISHTMELTIQQRNWQ